MGELVADYVLKRLREWGVERIYGFPGDGINAFLGALDRAQEKGGPEFIQARHEEMAAFMACGHAKFAGPDKIGVCMATSGPGAVHLLNGLYDAKLDHVPVLAIVGQQKRVSLGVHYQQEID
ncbi:MAG TPA: thiamine pyrophosphate-binding protein, partial [Gaiellaceae bacterium]|nr:thiamine pyrophosphate-binding protein [Gaiellaceae bacterium]